MEKQWMFPNEEGENRGDKKGGNRTPEQILRQLLALRGIHGREAEEEFLSARPQRTWDPFLMKDMEGAAARILQGAARGELICVYGDYDADGVTSVSLMLEILSLLTPRVSFYIPSRMDEGYGLNLEAMKTIASCGVGLVITVDCGSLSWEEVELAKELGMDVIVTDHHSTAGRRLADCLILNPKQEDCSYPFDGLCGCGVAFKLAQALQRSGAPISRGELNRQLDLVAIATIGDIVPLTDENRTLVKHGIRMISGEGRMGLVELMKQAGLKSPELTSDQIAYTIVPHLNAAGRMGTARTGVELLVAGRLPQLTEITPQGMETVDMPFERAADIAREKAAVLVERNKARKKVQESTYRDCLLQIEQRHREDLFYVIDAGKAHEGIAGIVAGKLKETFFRPTILVTESGEEKNLWKGTGRSVEGLDLFQLLSDQEKRFIRFGGHRGACGFLMEKDQLDPLCEALNQAVEQLLAQHPGLLTPTLAIADRLSLDEASLELAEALCRLSPFGNANHKPFFALSGLTVEKAFYMGAEKQHVRLTAGIQGDSRTLECLMFQRARELEGQISRWIEEKTPVEVAGSLEINQWNGRRTVQMILEDIR